MLISGCLIIKKLDTMIEQSEQARSVSHESGNCRCGFPEPSMVRIALDDRMEIFAINLLLGDGLASGNRSRPNEASREISMADLA